MDTTSHAWAVDRPVTSAFAHPSGLKGRLAGRFMLRTNNQRGVLGVLGVRPGDHVLEVGYGPGGLMRLLADRTGAAVVRGVDPSPEMRALASRVNRAAVRAGRVVPETGTAQDTGLDDRAVDRVVSVNNVAIWPDLEAGIEESHRVLRPGGVLVVAWHGGTDPGRAAGRLRLPADKLDRIEEALESRFPRVTRGALRELDVFRAVR
ncbi:class I SAM-dependent methyltransferase [Streptomyces sp. Ru87]|uniref:class I SAM-dependent methyltransferase n=1 Tax=Streptomyces sp. Ru87 TaxID=2044307 RepID=UPI000BF508E2|nr:methyltransferase domain-containing protein [Streptomyces sp. Ru87]PGH47923.1 SAM-dependent methyltransferase [Streptomyces sp. Ru87]